MSKPMSNATAPPAPPAREPTARPRARAARPHPVWVAGVVILTLSACGVSMMTDPTAAADGAFEALSPQQRIADFRAEAVYENETGQTFGARFRHVPTGFVLDVLRIQSVPQAFTWVNTPPPSDQGEPHTLEHLLLGKGNQGRYVASLEDMRLGDSSAFTQQLRTCYHFNTAAGPDVFFELFEAKLDAMLNPDFSDEEIRREVCHLGIVETEAGLSLEEKGTVYNEMVSTFERPWGGLYQTWKETLFGAGHPAAFSSGGKPDAIRSMTPEDLRGFHASTHHLHNMGTVVSIGDDIALDACLARLSGILKRVEPGAGAGEDPATLGERLPEVRPAAAGTVTRLHFPHQNPNEPGLMIFSWPHLLDLDPREVMLLELFVELMAGGENSNLYRRFIDSQTRAMDIGATSVFGWAFDEPGDGVVLGFSDVDVVACEESNVARVRQVIREEIEGIAAMAAGSSELRDFNERAKNLLVRERRELREFLNSPPRFGFRGTRSYWIDHLQLLHEKGGFRRNLALVDELAFAEELIGRRENIWRSYLETWGFIAEAPVACVTTPDPELLARQEAARDARIAAHVGALRDRYGVDDDAEAIAQFQDDYEQRTAAIETEAAKVATPAFLSDPPLTLDDRLDYRVVELSGEVPLVASTFDHITSATIGVALSLEAVPDSLLHVVPALPALLTDIGVVRDGAAIPYDVFTEMRRREILRLDARLDVSYTSGRAEVVIEAAGSARPENERALAFLDDVMFRADLSAGNLPRIHDVVDLELGQARNRTRRSEESWVHVPVDAYWRQDDALLLQAGCFFTRAHALARLRWRLREADPPVTAEVTRRLEALAVAGLDRDSLTARLETWSASAESGDAEASLAALAPESRALLHEAAEDIRKSLSDLPDETLAADVAYLCRQMSADLGEPAAAALASVRQVLDLVRRRGSARAYMISNSTDRDALQPVLAGILEQLDPAPAPSAERRRRDVVIDRLRARRPGPGRPLFVGLVHPSTRSGVHLHTADCASFRDTEPEVLLDFLAARLYGGGGAHSMFMKTWGAGLAYSNGLRSNERRGRLIYYAERCPDLAQTMQFVVGELEEAPADASLAEYAVAQAFGGGRAGARYDERGQSMAADLADGIEPAVVRRFRSAILELRQRPDFAAALGARIREVYGLVLPGLGPAAAEAARRANAIYFVIGPEAQLESWEAYLRGAEGGGIRLERLFPRDYWLVQEPPGLAGD